MENNEKREMLGHFLAALAYRNQKALRDSSDGFGAFSIDVRGVSFQRTII